MSPRGPTRREALGTALLGLGALALPVARADPGDAGVLDAAVGLPYRRALQRWTRELKLYRGLETSLLLHALFKAEAFRRAYAEERTRRYLLPEEDAALLLQRELDDGARFHEVLLAAWAPGRGGAEFAGADPPWTLRLLAEDGRSVTPVVVRRVRRPGPEILAFHPFIEAHDSVYVAKFPTLGPDGTPLLDGGGRRLALVVAGAMDRGRLSWPLGRRAGDP